MKPKVLLAGGTGYIGRYLSRVIEHDAQLFALSKYPKPDKGSTNKITWLKRDIYNHKDVVEAIERLGAYGVPVDCTDVEVKRPHINVELQTAKYDDVRTAMKMILPKKWTLNQLVDYFSRWLDETKGTFVHTQKQDHHYIIYNRNIKRPLAIFKMVNTTEDIITLHLVDGKLMKPKSKKQAKLEFRLLKGTRLIMVHLYDYIPRLFWPIYYFIQAPIQGLLMRGFEIDCRIKHYQGRIQSGEKIKYTK